MTEEERREMMRSNYAAQMEMLGYDASGNSLDMVRVVRCRDCKYSDVIYDTTSDTMPLKCLNIRYGGVQPEWYCEHGERRDDDAVD